MKRTRKENTEGSTLSAQVKELANQEVPKTPEYEGNVERVISTGSLQLDLAISGGRVRGGGLPGGILVEVFGGNSTGKTVLLCEIAGDVQRKGGQVMFKDPEARLNKQFARTFDMQPDQVDYDIPDTIEDLFTPVREWEPEPREGVIHAVLGDSLAALSTKMEMESEDKMGMKRAKDFSTQCRKTCRVLAQKNFLMVCSNQVRQNADAGMFGQKYTAPGGEAIGFYSSVRLRTSAPTKLKKTKKIKGKDRSVVEGIKTTVEVYKNSVWKPYRTAEVYILFDYGIDDIRANLHFVKEVLGEKTYTVSGTNVGKGMEEAIAAVEADRLEKKLRTETMDLWYELEEKLSVNRKRKRRF